MIYKCAQRCLPHPGVGGHQGGTLCHSFQRNLTMTASQYLMEDHSMHLLSDKFISWQMGKEKYQMALVLLFEMKKKLSYQQSIVSQKIRHIFSKEVQFLSIITGVIM